MSDITSLALRSVAGVREFTSRLGIYYVEPQVARSSLAVWRLNQECPASEHRLTPSTGLGLPHKCIVCESDTS